MYEKLASNINTGSPEKSFQYMGTKPVNNNSSSSFMNPS